MNDLDLIDAEVESHSSDVDSMLSIKKEPASPRDRSASPELTESRKRPISLVNNQCPRERQIVKVILKHELIGPFSYLFQFRSQCY